MKIFFVKRVDETSWNDFTAHVCVAENEEEALSFIPGGDTSAWTSKDYLQLTDIGIAHDDQEKGIILVHENGM